MWNHARRYHSSVLGCGRGDLVSESRSRENSGQKACSGENKERIMQLDAHGMRQTPKGRKLVRQG